MNNKIWRIFQNCSPLKVFSVFEDNSAARPGVWVWHACHGSQTRGLRAASGPPNAFVRPANMPENDKIIDFDQIYFILKAFLVNRGPQKLFF